ncbi:hypothetical protein [Lactiplantibacillus plajomi]|uniref:Uncharacterized protein n=1 Tax=Lactiplantibacillus plajomi TaxID=1457217 RepID=A0ABV6K2D6_9LACO|nr:hypothetical protein [Lactiplantibacillus plajomi]
MQLLINIVSVEPFDWNNLNQLVQSIRHQQTDNVKIQLADDLAQALTDEQRQALVTNPTTEWPTSATTYVLNLCPSDRLLPGAIAQWQSVLTEHPHTAISLATFNTATPVTEQAESYLARHTDNLLLDTYLRMSNAENVWPQLWGLQNYSLQGNLKSFKYLSQRLRPTGIILPADQLATTYPLAAVSQNLQLLNQQTEIIRLHVPTIQLTSWFHTVPLEWAAQLEAALTVPLTPDWQPQYLKYYRSQLKKLINDKSDAPLTDTQRQKLANQLERTPEMEA